jgi:hypothetical protein
MEVDDADAADNDYAKFTANGLEGRSYAEVLTDLSGQASGAFSFNSQALTSVGAIGCGAVTGTSTAVFEGASVKVGKASTTTGTLVLYDSNSANTITLTVPDVSAGSLSFTLPPTDGDAGEQLQTNGSGVLTWEAAGSAPALDKCKLRRDAAQSIGSGAWVKVLVDAEEFDVGGIGDIATNDRIDIGTTGYYEITASAGLGGVLDAAEFFAVGIYIDGGLVKRSLEYSHSTNRAAFGLISDVYYLTSGQYVELYLIHTEGAAQNTETTVYDRPVISVVQLQ